MKYYKKINFGKIIGMVAISKEYDLTIWNDGEIQVSNTLMEDVWYQQNEYTECNRDEFSTFFIEHKKQLDNLISEL